MCIALFLILNGAHWSIVAGEPAAAPESERTLKSRIGVDLQLDRDTVAKLAEAIISHKFGEKRLTSQRPYDVSLKDGKWMINGSFPGPGSGEFWGNGGVFHIVISQKDGQVLECWHTE